MMVDHESRVFKNGLVPVLLPLPRKWKPPKRRNSSVLGVNGEVELHCRSPLLLKRAQLCGCLNERQRPW